MANTKTEMDMDRKIDEFVGGYLKRWEHCWDKDQMNKSVNDKVVFKLEDPVDRAVGWERDAIEELSWDD